jgi:hypothetical protein
MHDEGGNEYHLGELHGIKTDRGRSLRVEQEGEVERDDCDNCVQPCFVELEAASGNLRLIV